MVIEIIPKDDIDKTNYFLIPKSNIKEESLLNKDIQIIQFQNGGLQNGGALSYSEGKIIKIVNKNPAIFFYDASTLPGSSGSPIVIDKEDEIIAIHKGSLKDNGKNVGLFIGWVIDKIKNYKRNGTYKEFYENGDLKYEGKFLDD